MLPSTGYFKGINCPFYDSGLCERPYCHFRHVKKDTQNTSDGIESGAILQKLVSAAVQKVLQQSETSVAVSTETSAAEDAGDSLNSSQAATKATYNPTPISELNKNNVESETNDDTNEQKRKHIPVPYTPRKPASLGIKRTVESEGASEPFIYIPPPVKYTPGSAETVQLDPYTPKGTTETNEKYLPGTEVELQEYTPNKTSLSTKVNYVPSDKTSKKKKILEYKPVKVTAKNEVSGVTYQPTPRSMVPCFSSDEDEPERKKRKLSSDLNGFDDLGPEFEILDEILHEEKPKQLVNDLSKEKAEKLYDIKSEKHTETGEDPAKKDQSNKEKSTSRSEENKSHVKNKSDSKLKPSSHDKHERSTKGSDKNSKHKSSHKDKNGSKEEQNNKSSEKKKHSSSKKHDKRTEKEKKYSDKHSKHRSSSKSSSKKENKNDHRKSHNSSKDLKDKHKHSKYKESLSNNVSDNESNTVEEMEQNYEEAYTSESDEEAINLECKKIFEEYVPAEKVNSVEEKIEKIDDTNEDEYIPGKKRVSRTADKNIKVLPKAPVKPDFKINAAQTMAERLAKVKEYHASKAVLNSTTNDIAKAQNVFSVPNSGNTKIRIAHVPYASTLMNAKKTISSNSKVDKGESSTSSTIVQTVKKGVQRVAHMPSEKFIDRPGVLEPLASKIPANIRSTYLNMMIDECLKIYLSSVDAYARAQHEELTTSKKCSTVQIYKNSAVLTISRLRKELQECNGIKKSGSDCTTLQKMPTTVSGKTGSTGSWSIENKNRRLSDHSQEFSGGKLYKNISKWILTEQQLQDNGYPISHPSGEKGKAIIYGQKKQNPPKGFIRTCCRCKKDYIVDKKGFAAVKEECIYHPNNKYRVRGEVRYQCCSQDGTSDGCCIAQSHVYEYIDYENLKGYVRTFPPEKEMDDYGVYSLDCEMCYTTHGLDLTRITVINSSCKVVYETLIKPLHPIIDYNTRYSGITEEQMANVKTTLLEVQATLLSMFNSKTILIGHSLESDFKALKLIHDTVIDTSVLYPHKMGPPYKRALRNLCSEHLKKIIQNSVDGHDSAEDATVCMELIHFKLKEDLKTR